MNRINENNKVFINGRIASDVEFVYEFYGEGFYEFQVEIPRISGVYDTIPVIVSERIFNTNKDYSGMVVSVFGEYRSFNKRIGDRTSLMLSLFANEIEFEEYPMETCDNNSVELIGYICKEANYRRTPKGRDIADVIIAVNRGNGKSDYIPCICWGRNARYAENFEVGGHIQLWGRIQSREYQKKISENEYDKRIAYEVSVSKMEYLGEQQLCAAVAQSE